MKKNITIYGVTFFFTILFCMTEFCHATWPDLTPFTFELSPLKLPDRSGPGDLKLSFSPKHHFCKDEDISVTINTKGSLKYIGEKTWGVQADKDHPYSTVLHINIPPNDTSSIHVDLGCGKITHTIVRYFVTTNDSLEYWRGNPRDYRPFPKQPRMGSRKGWVIPGEFPKDDSLYGIPEQTEKLLLDSTKAINLETGEIIEKKDLPSSKQQKPGHQITSEELRKREKTPCTRVTGERIRIGDEVWVRNKGEYKYRQAVPATDLNTKLLKLQREAEEKKEKVTHHITMDLRNSEDYDFVKYLVDSLKQMERKGFYHTFIKKETIGKIENKGIRCARYPNYPGEKKERFNLPKSGDSDLLVQ